MAELKCEIFKITGIKSRPNNIAIKGDDTPDLTMMAKNLIIADGGYAVQVSDGKMAKLPDIKPHPNNPIKGEMKNDEK